MKYVRVIKPLANFGFTALCKPMKCYTAFCAAKIRRCKPFSLISDNNQEKIMKVKEAQKMRPEIATLRAWLYLDGKASTRRAQTIWWIKNIQNERNEISRCYCNGAICRMKLFLSWKKTFLSSATCTFKIHELDFWDRGNLLKWISKAKQRVCLDAS